MVVEYYTGGTSLQFDLYTNRIDVGDPDMNRVIFDHLLKPKPDESCPAVLKKIRFRLDLLDDE